MKRTSRKEASIEGGGKDGPWACLGDQHVAIHVAVDGRVPLDAHQAVLLGVVQPVAGAPGADQALQLVGLHPHQLVHALVAPDLQALAAQLHGAPCRNHSHHSGPKDAC